MDTPPRCTLEGVRNYRVGRQWRKREADSVTRNAPSTTHGATDSQPFRLAASPTHRPPDSQPCRLTTPWKIYFTGNPVSLCHRPKCSSVQWRIHTESSPTSCSSSHLPPAPVPTCLLLQFPPASYPGLRTNQFHRKPGVSPHHISHLDVPPRGGRLPRGFTTCSRGPTNPVGSNETRVRPRRSSRTRRMS
jgi:hypothetical protein